MCNLSVKHTNRNHSARTCPTCQNSIVATGAIFCSDVSCPPHKKYTNTNKDLPQVNDCINTTSSYSFNTSYIVIYEKPCAQRDKRSRHVAEAPCMHNCIYDAALAWLPPLYNEYLNAVIFLPELGEIQTKANMEDSISTTHTRRAGLDGALDGRCVCFSSWPSKAGGVTDSLLTNLRDMGIAGWLR